jgi:hypothetical protein
MIGRKYELVDRHSDFYRDYYYKLLRGIGVLSVVLLLLIVAIIYQVFFTASPSYYGSAASGQIISLTS